MNTISVLTATYNRGYLIERLYESLKSQTNKDFEWIIIDDGSTDDTKRLIEKIQKEEKNFNIIYEYQKNHGKHVAINRAVSLSKGEYVIIVDSDDILSKDAISTILKWIKDIPVNKKIAGVAGLKADIKTKKPIGDFPKNKEIIFAKNTDRRKKHLLGDKAEVYKTSLLRKNPFKVFKNEKFLTENTVWNELAHQGYEIIWYNKIIYFCEYLNDGLTKQGSEKDIRNFEGFTYATLQRIKCQSLLEGIIAIGRYYYISKIKGLSNSDISKKIKKNMVIIYFCYFLWKLKEVIINGKVK